MYLSNLTVRNFRQFGDGDAALDIAFNSDVTALVGRNDSGKSTVIDAIRYALLTRDQDFIRVQPEDFHTDKAGIAGQRDLYPLQTERTRRRRERRLCGVPLL